MKQLLRVFIAIIVVALALQFLAGRMNKRKAMQAEIRSRFTTGGIISIPP